MGGRERDLDRARQFKGVREKPFPCLRKKRYEMMAYMQLADLSVVGRT